MDISRIEQRILHLLAQGGRIEIEKNDKKRIASVKCLTREAGTIQASTSTCFES